MEASSSGHNAGLSGGKLKEGRGEWCEWSRDVWYLVSRLQLCKVTGCGSCRCRGSCVQKGVHTGEFIFILKHTVSCKPAEMLVAYFPSAWPLAADLTNK
jgi:hypothetical protein